MIGTTRPHRAWQGGLWAGLMLALAGSGAQAQAPADAPTASCPAGTITFIFIDNHSVFDTSAEVGNTLVRWAYSLANTFHFRTRQSFIEGELLFRVGDCLDPFLIQESGRLLRQYTFLASADVFAVRQPDGSNHVVVDTWDEWSTRFDVGVAISDGFELRRISITETNFLGSGTQIGVFYRERRELKETGLEVISPRLLSTRWDGRLSVGRTRVGDFFIQELAYPFLGEVGQVAVRQQIAYRENLFAYSAPGHPDFSSVLLPFNEQRIEITGARRCCEPRRYTIFGLGFTYEGLTFPGFPGSVEVAQDGQFDDAEPADSATIATVARQAVERETTRLNLVLGRRQVGFAQRRALDAINGVQDVAFGWEIQGTSGLSLPFLTPSGQGKAPQDLFAASQVFYGDAPNEQWVLNTAGSVESRYVFEQGDSNRGWRDVIAEVDVYAYFRSTPESRHTFFVRGLFAAGWNMESPFQITLGGDDMLRGYGEEDFPGGRRMVLNLEDRIRIPSPLEDLFDLGFTVFADVGRMWAGDVPYGADSGIQGTLGAGLRFGMPPDTRRVVRIDVAVPVGSRGGFNNLVFRITGQELLGLITGVEDRQLARSRRSGLSAGLFDSPVR